MVGAQSELGSRPERDAKPESPPPSPPNAMGRALHRLKRLYLEENKLATEAAAAATFLGTAEADEAFRQRLKSVYVCVTQSREVREEVTDDRCSTTVEEARIGRSSSERQHCQIEVPPFQKLV